MLDKVAREYLFEEVMFEKKLKEGETKSVMIWGGGSVSGERLSCAYRMFGKQKVSQHG